MDGWEGFISWFSNYKPDSEWHMIFQSRCTKNFWGSDNQIEFIICHAGKDVVLFEPCCIEMLKKSLLYNEPLSNITEVSPSVLNFSIVMLSSCCTSSLARITVCKWLSFVDLPNVVYWYAGICRELTSFSHPSGEFLSQPWWWGILLVHKQLNWTGFDRNNLFQYLFKKLWCLTNNSVLLSNCVRESYYFFFWFKVLGAEHLRVALKGIFYSLRKLVYMQ